MKIFHLKPVMFFWLTDAFSVCFTESSHNLSVFCLSLCFSLHIRDPVSFSSRIYSLILVDHILYSSLRMDTWQVSVFCFFRTPVFENVFILLLLLIKIWLDLYIRDNFFFRLFLRSLMIFLFYPLPQLY